MNNKSNATIAFTAPKLAASTLVTNNTTHTRRFISSAGLMIGLFALVAAVQPARAANSLWLCNDGDAPVKRSTLPGRS